MSYRKIICVDFDGVLHSYKSGWKGVDVVADPPVEGALAWLSQLCNDPDLQVMVYSSRSKAASGIYAMQRWLEKYGFDSTRVEFPTEKPVAFLTIDDRAWLFTGTFPALEEIHSFKSWVSR